MVVIKIQQNGLIKMWINKMYAGTFFYHAGQEKEWEKLGYQIIY